MTDDDKALVERLLDFLHSDDVFAVDWKDIAAAAEGIEALSAESERMRDALENIVNNCGECSGYGTYPAEETATGKVLWRDCPSPQCHSARVALGETE